MNRFSRKSFFSLLWPLLFGLSACQERAASFKDVHELSKWMNNPKNGLVKTKSISGIKLTVRYLPAEYVAYQELKDNENTSDAAKDSVLALYKNNLTFLFSIGPDESYSSEIDIMRLGIGNYDEYSERALKLNFGMDEYVILKMGERKYQPVLSTLENVYGLSKQRNIYFVFAPEEPEADFRKNEKLDFVFDDEIFNTGISHFIFLSENIKKIPSLSFFAERGASHE